MSCNGCGEKDLKEIAAAGAKMTKELMNRLDGNPQGVSAKQPEKQNVKRVLSRLTGDKENLIRQQQEIINRAQNRIKELLVMAMPDVPSDTQVQFNPNTLEFFVLEELDLDAE